MDKSGWSYVQHQPGTERSSLLAANASVGGSAVPARVGYILTVGGKRVRFTESLFQAGFTGNRIDGFHGTSHGE